MANRHKYETRSEFSGTQLLMASRHISGRRDVRMFATDARLNRIEEHINDPRTGLMAQLQRAIRLGRTDKTLLLLDMVKQAKGLAYGLREKIAVAYAKPSVPLATGRILLDLTAKPYPTATRKQRFGAEQVNHGRVFVSLD